MLALAGNQYVAAQLQKRAGESRWNRETLESVLGVAGE